MTEPISLPTIIPRQTIELSDRMGKIRTSLKAEKPLAPDKADSHLKKACSDLESLFVYHLLKEMRATIPNSGFITGGRAEELYTSMMDEHLAKELSSKRGIGLSSILFDQLSNRQSCDSKGKAENSTR